MGGLSKHMMHPYDDLDLSRKSLGSMMETITFAPMLEKIDGLNIHFMNVGGELRMARNNKDLASGGFSQQELQDRFAGSSNHVLSTYANAYLIAARCDLIRMIPEWNEHHVTINAECVSGVTNIINYGNRNTVVLHNKWYWKEEDGKFKPFEIELITIDPMKDTYGEIISDPIITCYLPIRPDFDELHNLLKAVFHGQETIRDLYRYNFLHIIKGMHGSLLENPATIRELFNRFFEKPTMNLRDLRKMTPDAEALNKVLANRQSIFGAVRSELERVVLDYGQMILKNCTGYLNEGCSGYDELEQEYLNAARDPEHVQYDPYLYNKNRRRMTNMTPNPLEGAVFGWEGKQYKWTGSFALINNIVGTLKRR